MEGIRGYDKFVLDCLIQLQKDLNDFISRDYFSKLDEIDKSIIRSEKELADARTELFNHLISTGGMLYNNDWREFTDFILTAREDLTDYLNQCAV